MARLLPVLPQLSAKHHLLLAAVSDPRVDQMAAGRSDAAAVYDAAAAERSRNDRGAIATRLRRSGVEVVDAPPAELAPALADHLLNEAGELRMARVGHVNRCMPRSMRMFPFNFFLWDFRLRNRLDRRLV